MYNNFTLFSKKVPLGKTVVFYCAYDEATEHENKITARNYCNNMTRNIGIIKIRRPPSAAGGI